MFIFVLDANKRPLAPTHPARARQLLRKGKAAVYRRYPFTIILKHDKMTAKPTSFSDVDSQPLRLKIDPGSNTTGIAILNDRTGKVVFAAELHHRGRKIKKAMDSRRTSRRSRRNRKTRYREPRFSNRTRPMVICERAMRGGYGGDKPGKFDTATPADTSQPSTDKPACRVRCYNDAFRAGWLPPSLKSRVANIETWVARLRRVCPICAISFELAKFDTQKMQKATHAFGLAQNPEISGVEYQQGELHGFEIREYLLEKFGRKCVYCGKDNVPLQVEHIIPKSRDGSNRVSNLTLSCVRCNTKKGTKTAEEFGYPKVQEQAKKPYGRSSGIEFPLKDAAVLNITRKAIERRLQKTGLPIEIGTGALTKYNRTKCKLPKAHWLDAACVGVSTPQMLKTEGISPLSIIATGHGTRQICSLRSAVTS